MKGVRIAELKSHLSQHLRQVRAGQTLTVYDRTTPVARLVPWQVTDDVWITKPVAKSLPIGRVKLPRGRKIETDVVTFLLQDRHSRR